MNLHQNKTLFRQAVQFTSDQMRIPAIYVEKDYWVTCALFAIFNREIGKDTVFKGGTALSKCFNMVERFSEDIDLVVLRHEGETDNILKSKLKRLGMVVEEILPELEVKGITNKKGMVRKTAHAYQKSFMGNYGQIRDVVVLESTWLGNGEPYITKNIISFVGNMMQKNGQTEIAKEYGLLPFPLFALHPTRTICEKIMSLVRFSYSPNPLDDLKRKIRHIYDLHQLLRQEEYSVFLHSTLFNDMLIRVGNDDKSSFRNNNHWLGHHPSDAIIFKDLNKIWNELKVTYNSDFRNLVYGDFPEDVKILASLLVIQQRLLSVRWSIFIV